MRVLVLYASRHGQTAAIAIAIAARLEQHGCPSYAVDIDQQAPAPDDYDVVILGSRIHMNQPARSLRRYVKTYRERLPVDATGYFTVSMAAASPTAAGHEAAEQCLERSLRAMRWAPRWTAALGGALPFPRYGRVLRWLMARAAGSLQMPTDTGRTHVLTDWGEVARFADAIAADLVAPEAPAPGVESTSAAPA